MSHPRALAALCALLPLSAAADEPTELPPYEITDRGEVTGRVADFDVRRFETVSATDMLAYLSDVDGFHWSGLPSAMRATLSEGSYSLYERGGDERTDLQRTALIWQGLRHRWNFFPHRISRLGSWIDGLVDEEPLPGVQVAAATFHMAQSVGVDGDGMSPLGTWSMVRSDAIYSTRGKTVVEWTDQTTSGCAEVGARCAPEAISALRVPVTIDLQREALGWGALDDYTLVMRGFDLEVCDEGDCDTLDGAWFSLFDLGYQDCALTPGARGASEALTCELAVHAVRAWEPVEGSATLPSKPFTELNSYRLTVYHSAIGGDEESLDICPNEPYVDRRDFDEDGPEVVAPVGCGGPAWEPITAVTGFGWELSRTESASLYRREGRYLREISFDADVPPGLPVYGVNVTQAQVSASYLHSESGRVGTLRTTQIAVRDRDAVSAVAQEAEGQICIDDGWHLCTGVVEQSEDEVPIYLILP